MSSASLLGEMSNSSGSPSRSPDHGRPHRPSMRHFSLNLASLLNDPKQPRPHDLFTRDWGEAFVPSAPQPSPLLKGARKEDFLPFLQRQEETLAKLQRLSTQMALDDKKSKSASARPTSPESIELASIPAMFFSPEFDLGKRDIYTSIMLPADPRLPQLTHSTLQHERLSHYLDIVEMHLALKIAQRSDRFLGAISSHEVLRTRLQAVLDQMAVVRARMASAEAAMVTANLRVLHLVSRQAAMKRLEQKLAYIAEVNQTQANLQQLLAVGDFIAALDLIDAAQGVLRRELMGVHSLRHLGLQLGEMRRVVEQLMDQDCVTAMLDGVRALAAALPARYPVGGSDAATEALQLDANLADRLDAPPLFAGVFAHLAPAATATASAATSTVTTSSATAAHVSSATVAGSAADSKATSATPAPATSTVAATSAAAATAAVVEEHTLRLAVALLGLARQGRGAFVSKYFDSVGEQLKLSIKQSVVEFFTRTSPAAADMGDSRSSWAESMRGLPFRNWMQLLLSVYESCLVQVHAVSTLHGVFRNIISEAYPDVVTASFIPETTLEPARDDTATPALRVSASSATSTGGDSDPGPATTDVRASRVSPVPEADELHHSAFDDGPDGLDDLDADVAASSVDVDLAQLDRRSSIAGNGEFTHATNGSAAQDVATEAGAGAAGTAAVVATGVPVAAGPVPSTLGRAPSTVSTVSRLGLDDALPSQSPAAAPAPTAIMTPEENARQLLALSNRGMIEFGHQAHVRCAKLLSARVKDGADASLAASQFIELFQVSQAFVQTSEHAVGASFPELRGALLAQAKRFLDKFHARQREKLLLILANENWSQVDVPNECQAQVEMLSRTVVSRPASSVNLKQITIGGQQFRAVGSLLMFLKLLSEYCKCAQDLPILAADIYTRIADVLRTFNSQTYRLVLRAEALQTVGLRTITARHLGLSAQALGAVLALIPPVQARFRELLPDKMHILLGEFAGIPADYEVHRRQLFTKLASIMEDVWVRNVKDMTWSKGAGTAGVRAVAKSAVKLHTTITGILAHAEMATVFEAIAFHAADKLLEAIRARDTKDKLLLIGIAADVLHLEEQLGPLSSVPVELLRRRLADTPLSLPPYVPATVPAAAATPDK